MIEDAEHGVEHVDDLHPVALRADVQERRNVVEHDRHLLENLPKSDSIIIDGVDFFVLQSGLAESSNYHEWVLIPKCRKNFLKDVFVAAGIDYVASERSFKASQAGKHKKYLHSLIQITGLLLVDLVAVYEA